MAYELLVGMRVTDDGLYARYRAGMAPSVAGRTILAEYER